MNFAYCLLYQIVYQIVRNEVHFLAAFLYFCYQNKKKEIEKVALVFLKKKIKKRMFLADKKLLLLLILTQCMFLLTQNHLNFQLDSQFFPSLTIFCTSK